MSARSEIIQRRKSVLDLPFSLAYDDSQDHVVCGDDASLDFSASDFSVAFRVKMRSGHLPDNYYLFHRGRVENGEDGYWFQMEGGGSTPTLRFGARDTGASDNASFAFGLLTFDVDIHLVVTWDNATNGVECFANGISIGTDTLTNGIGNVSSDNNFYIGALNGLVKGLFGNITDFHIYNTKLDAAAAADLYYDGVIGSPITSYKFREGVGGSLSDSVGSNHGTINGPTWSIDTPSKSRFPIIDFDNSLNFAADGDSCELTVTDAEVDPTADYTAVWVMKMPVLPVPEDAQMFGQQNGAASVLRMAAAAFQSSPVSTVFTFGLTPPIGKWFRFALRHNAATKEIILDAALLNGDRLATLDSITYTGTPASTGAKTWRWGSNGGSNQVGFFKGLGFNFFASYLTDQQINIYMETGVLPVGALEELLLPEGSGTTSANAGSNGGNANLSSAALWNPDIPSQARLELSQARVNV